MSTQMNEGLMARSLGGRNTKINIRHLKQPTLVKHALNIWCVLKKILTDCYIFVFHDKVTKIRVDVTRRPRSSTKITLWHCGSLLSWCLPEPALVLGIVNNHSLSLFTIHNHKLLVVNAITLHKKCEHSACECSHHRSLWTILCVAHKAK